MTKIIAWGQRVNRVNVLQPPGNSIRLIDAAYSYGYDGVELDVQMTKDDVMVLMHNNTVDQTTYSTGTVNQFTADELKQFVIKDPWNGPVSYVESLETALRRNGPRGLVMVDQHHAVPRTVAAVKRSVEGSGFDPAKLLLLTYNREGGMLYKAALPESTVLLKARHDQFPPELDLSFVDGAVGLDGVLAPLAKFKDEMIAFRQKTSAQGLKLAVFMHDNGAEALRSLIEIGPDYITSFDPSSFGAVRAAAS